MPKQKIFISYDYDNDKTYKNLLLAWAANSDFDFSFEDMSADVSIDSKDAAVIKSAISAKINSATHFLCIIGKHTWKSKWVAWEIEKAVELKKKIVAVKIENTNTSPDKILEVGASWAFSFSFDSIKKAIKGA